MTIGIKARSEAYLEAAQQVRAIDAKPTPEPERLEEIVGVLKALAARTELFPLRSFPRVEGTPGGLYRLAAFPDQRGAVYISLGHVGRSQQPHNHVSWAVVAGVSGGRETNVVYDRIEGDEPGEARLILRERVPVGPGDAVVLPTGAYHTIDVDSGPSLHLHAYSWAVDTPGFETYGFDSPQATTYSSRKTGGFKPPLSAVADEDLLDDLASGDAVVLVLEGSAPSTLVGPHVLRASPEDADAVLAAAGVSSSTPVVLVATPAVALETAQALYAAGRPLVFEYRPDAAEQRAVA